MRTMGTNAKGKLVRIYIGESDLWHSEPLYLALIEKLRKEGAAGASVFRGVAGFGAHSRIHTATVLRLSEDLPILVEWIDTSDRVERLLPDVAAMVGEGMITSEEVEVIFYRHRGVADISSRLKVKDVMTPRVVTVSPETSLRQAIGLLVGQDYRALPVVDGRQRVVGIVTNGDFIERGGLRMRIELLGALSAEELANVLAAVEDEKSVASIMTTPAITIQPDASLADAAHLMVTRSLKRLPVVDASGTLLGMLSRLDLLRTQAEVYPRPVPEFTPHPGQTIGEVMRTDVPVVGQSATLAEVLDAVVATRLNRVIVVDEERRPVGIVTDAELLRRLSPEDHPSVVRILMARLPFIHLSPEEQHRLEHAMGRTAEELMEDQIPTVPTTTPLGEAIGVMLRGRRKILPVVDDQGRLLGAADRADLLRTLVGLQDDKTYPKEDKSPQ